MGHIGELVTLNDPSFIHETAYLYGKVTVGKGSSVFPYVVVRAEFHEVMIGENTNIQDHVVIHVGDFTPTVVGDNCSITHNATLHGCTIGDRCLIGINATIMDGATIGSNSIVAGHTIVTANQHFPENSVIAGVPAKQIGEKDNSEKTLFNARVYSYIANNYANGVERISEAQMKALFEAGN